ncbi:hypothetical protein [Pseudonocardia sp. HH130630-07]|uniref:hypothetical protein n=1 Tax=Pseudonocardia sp. HH130630-07 TaxID=1690815 RepID=UPI000815394A|nr:hypothetical protein [Pseudonocardia sp. HH130630-07]ANY09398.1 hypothetical protein AFB00_27710 [Pseudonocardia sp. HH130630-07]
MAEHPATPGDTLIFENDRVRVWSMTLEADGGMFDFHQHHHDHLVLWPDAGTAEAQELGDTGWGVRQVAEPGFCMFKTVGSGGPMRPHRIRNVGPAAVTHYVVEFVGERSLSPVTLPAQTNDRGRLSHPDLG